jgi:peptidoglycan/xylan/chitin deacetylase (PgdA/CDA1 family)
MNRALVRRTLLYALDGIVNLLPQSNGMILCLHSVVPEGRTPGVSNLAVNSCFLERLIIDLRQRGIALVSLDEALQRLARRDGKPFVALTFDDGYRDNYDVAFPVFLRHDVPFAVFLTTGFIDRIYPIWWHVLEHLIERNDAIDLDGVLLPAGNPAEKAAVFDIARNRFRRVPIDGICSIIDRMVVGHRSDLSPKGAYGEAMDWQMIREMSDSGLATFGCHTVSHPVLSDLDGNGVREEVLSSRDRFEQATGRRAAYFAYPFGQDHEVGDIAPDVVREAGFTAAFTTRPDILSFSDLERPERIPRITISPTNQSEAMVRAYLSGLPSAIRRAMQGTFRPGRSQPDLESAA